MTNRRSIWLFSVVVSVLLISGLLWFIDLSELSKALQNTHLELLTMAIIPLALEALITAKRIQYCAYNAVSFTRAIYCNAWYVMWLSVLPARLGEVAAIALFKKQLGMTVGGAIASIVVQRIYDVIVLCGFLILLLSQTVLDGTTGMLVATALGVLLVLVLANLTNVLTFFSHLLYPWRKKNNLFNGFLRLLLQARTWHRHHQGVVYLSLITCLKWIVNLLTVVLIFAACEIQLGVYELLLIAVIIHFLGAIPIQSVGGFGVVEVGLTGLLVAYGIEPAQALATSLVLRFVSLSYAAAFFLTSLIAFGKKDA